MQINAKKIDDSNDYRVSLDAFEGPLDLLLYLIKKDDVDIYDIPVAHLLEQYLEYIELAKELNIDLAGEFLEMAAELTYLKSRMLLPEIEAEEDEGPDPRADLVNRLMEYQRFKCAGQALWARPQLNRDVFRRDLSQQDLPQLEEEVTVQIDLVALLQAFQGLLKRMPKEKVHEIRHSSGVDIGERMVNLAQWLKGRERVTFEDLFVDDKSTSEVVVTFLAILQMAKQGFLSIFHEPTLGKIYISPKIIDDPVVISEEDKALYEKETSDGQNLH